MSGLTALVKGAKAARKAEPFYSAVDEAAQALARGKGTGKEFMTELIKVKGVKPTEIKDRGLQKIETMPKMTKEQFLAELEKRPPPQVEEKVLRDPTKGEIEEHAHALAYEDSFDELRAEGMNRHEAEDIAAEMAEDRIDDFYDRAREELLESGGDAPYHGNFAIEGGKNYREILLKMPGFKDDKKLMELESMRRRVDPDTNPSRHQELTQKIEELQAKKAAVPDQYAGKREHFGGEPGILASIRVSDRVGPKGEKILHVEEIQSDWHQAGRKQGYRSQDAINAYAEYEKALPERTVEKITQMFIEAGTEPERARALAEKQLKTVLSMSRERNLGPSNMAAILGEEKQMKSLWDAARAEKDKVPDAPFKKNWHELAMKRMLNYAADNGYDKVAITPGAEQADRYSLAKHVDRLEYFPESGNLVGVKDGKPVVSETVTKDQLESYVGKDAAKRLLEQEPQKAKRIGETTMQLLEGEDLKLGGEGMKGFYDKMLPDYLNSYGKKYGAQVTPLDIVTHPEKSIPQISAPGIDYYPEPVIEPAKTATVHGFDITPEMRQDITGKGLPLYQQIGIPAGGAAAGAEALEGEEQGFAGGGAVTGPMGSEYDTMPDMADGGRTIQGSAFKKGGRVHVTDNPDIMLLDLLSRN